MDIIKTSFFSARVLFLAAAAALACGPLSAENPAPAAQGVLQPAERSNAIGLKFYAGTAAGAGNTVFSPYSLYSAVSMTYDSARDSTEAEMRGVFGFPADRDALRRETSLLRRGLIRSVKGSEFGRVNAFWFQRGYELLPEYEAVLKSSYSASAEYADFRSSAERARTAVNTWARQQTGGRITGVFEKNSLTQLTQLMLVSAAYFKGSWKIAFSTDNTSEQDFTLAGGEKVKAQMMSSAQPVKINYYQDDDLQAVGLDYLGGGLRMLVLLPGEGHSADETGKDLSPEKLADIRKGLSGKTVPVLIFLPRFKISGSWDLAAGLSALGMPQAFTETADLSGMTGRKGLYLQKAVQKNYVEVSEEGAALPAAAAPARRGKKPQVFRADRPFLFLIENKRTGLILFMGRLDDPLAV